MSTLLQIAPGTSFGGAERYAVTIGAAAASEGWDVHAAFPYTRENERLAGAFRDASVTPHPLDYRRGGPALMEVGAEARRTGALLAQVKPSVVQVNLPFPTFARGSLLALALRGVPTVVVFHLTPARFDAGRIRRLYPAIRARGQTWVAVSEHGRQAIVQAFRLSPDDVTVIPNGVPAAPPGPPSEEARIELRRELGLPDSAFVALSVGRLSAQKAHADIIPAAREAARHFPHVNFVIAGEGEERPALEALVRTDGLEGTVHLLGQRDDVARLLRASDLFLLPSHSEGFPFALLEAAAYRLPIISADFGGARELVAHHDSALLHPPGDTQALWQCLRHAVEHVDDMRRMGNRAHEVTARFSEAAMVGSMLALLSNAARSAY